MQYLLMCCINEASWDALPATDRDAVMRDYGELIRDLAQQGRYVAGAKLRSTATATTVRQRNGRPVLTDGPFAETKEQLGGYYLIEAKDLNDALQVAAKIPSAKLGTVEVRPIQEYN